MSEISIKYPKGNIVHAIGSLKFWGSIQARWLKVIRVQVECKTTRLKEIKGVKLEEKSPQIEPDNKKGHQKDKELLLIRYSRIQFSLISYKLFFLFYS